MYGTHDVVNSHCELAVDAGVYVGLIVAASELFVSIQFWIAIFYRNWLNFQFAISSFLYPTSQLASQLASEQTEYFQQRG